MIITVYKPSDNYLKDSHLISQIPFEVLKGINIAWVKKRRLDYEAMCSRSAREYTAGT